ncbi:hypothetical protein B0T20DRAFT_150567 [Sordaria brevicollis]|uniref:Uncharacterized protein n=1 Tax=Sordaria brevicollis TaxID=83679 RepID=A0AAE0PIW1_SORBR|nr:hypothetical protein B0T20DRAFT_150567 [Sordaria brevicollis]
MRGGHEGSVPGPGPGPLSCSGFFSFPLLLVVFLSSVGESHVVQPWYNLFACLTFPVFLGCFHPSHSLPVLLSLSLLHITRGRRQKESLLQTWIFDGSGLPVKPVDDVTRIKRPIRFSLCLDGGEEEFCTTTIT